ncbi:MAG: hypothetical protein K2X81_11105, partial [Candidatus Obscuribacterales bacterium]|nr:hypothetical protein [Candidatus Obscuribacterales bacterium]
QLYVDNYSVQKSLASLKSPVAEQVLQRWHLMQDQGWTIEKAGSLVYDKSGRPSRMSSAGLFQMEERYLGYKPTASTFQRILGGASPNETAASVLAHEISHHDGHFRHYLHPNDLEANAITAKRILATESRALVTQVHLAQVGGAGYSQAPHVEGALKALRADDLGGYIHRNWANWDSWSLKTDQLYAQGPNYMRRYNACPNPEFGFITEQEARLFVNEYLKETFGSNLVDPVNGKVRAFDLDAGLGKMNSPALPADHAKLNSNYRWQLQAGEPAYSPHLPTVTASERNFGRVVRGVQVVGSLGLLCMAGDVHKSFQKGLPSGAAKLGEVALSWGAFEAGLALSSKLVGKVNPYCGLAVGFAAGTGSAILADYMLGDKVRTTLSTSAHSLTRKY